jgi:hypothetical protein
MNCAHCNELVPDHRQECPACGTDNGFPNVRQAKKLEEVNALNKRIGNAMASATARGTKDQLKLFGSAIEKSKAVVSRGLTDVKRLAESNQNSYSSFARQVQAGARDPADNKFDKIRSQFENALFPNYFGQILFASLSLEDKGLSGYGECDMVLKDMMISSRTSVFEENPFIFSKKHALGLTDTIPHGYRATWENRSSLCLAKLHSSIEKITTETQFASILQNDDGGTDTSDFVEVHIYGTLNIKSVEKIIVYPPITREDKFLWRTLQRDLRSSGVEALVR